MKIIECVPNFSEGRDMAVIKSITNSIETVSGVTLLDVDPGSDTNRTVVTFVGTPDDVIDAAFKGIQKATEIIDMSLHSGAHARMGATDVCPLVPILNTNMEECVQYSKILAERVGNELNIPIFLYEHSATSQERRNLAEIRSGEFEGMVEKLSQPYWKPDYGPAQRHESAGVTAIGARNFLIAYNINLNTRDKRVATDIAFDIREKGRNKRDKMGKFLRDKEGKPIKSPGILKSCKAVGWYIEEYNLAQISMNLTDFDITPPHVAFEETRKQARKRGVRVIGSELVGLIPLDAIIAAGRYYLKQQHCSIGIPTKDIIHIAVKSMGLDDLSPFDPNEKIIEYRIKDLYGPLASKTVHAFADELSSNSPAPGGGSVSALAGALAASLAAMVANLTFGKKEWDPLYDQMCKISQDSQALKEELLNLIDADSDAFNHVLDAYKLPQKTEDQVSIRNNAIDKAMKAASNIPFRTLQCCRDVINYAHQTAKMGNPNSISDAGVSAELAYAGAMGAAMNVKINLKEIDNKQYCQKMQKQTSKLIKETEHVLELVRRIVSNKINND